MTNIYAITDSHQECRNLSQLLSGIYNLEKNNNKPFIVLDAGDIFKGIYDKELTVNAYLKLKELLPQAQIFLTLGNNDFGFKKEDFEYLKNTIRVFENAGIYFLCANIVDSKTQQKPNWIPTHKIIDINNKKILITGFCLNNSCAKKFGYDLLQAEESYTELINNLTEKYDKIIVLNHHWYSYSKKLKEYAPEIDLIIGGHEHSPIEADFENNIFYPLSFARTLYKIELEESFKNIQQISATSFKFIQEFEQPIIEYEQSSKLKEPIAKRVLNLTKKYSDACPLGTFISDAMRKAGKTDIAFHSTGFTMYPLKIEDSDFITKYDIDRVICATSTIEKINITTAQLKEIFENTTTFRHLKNQGNQRFLQCSQNMSIKVRYKNNTYNVVQININGEDLLDTYGEPIQPNKTFTCTIDPYIGNGEQGFSILKDLTKTKILQNNSEIPLNKLFQDALIEVANSTNKTSDYPCFEYLDI